MNQLRDYAGAIHIHTTCSDGSGTIQEVIEAARKARLDFIIVTDHGTLRHKTEGREGWYEDLLVLVGEEISPKRNHYLALNTKTHISPDGRPAEWYISEVKKQGGLGFIVHPHSKGKLTLPIVRNRPWTAWDNNEFTGIELWSYMLDWVDPVHIWNLPYYYRHPEKAVTGPEKDAVKLWDTLTGQRRVVAIGGVDAHAKRLVPFGFLKVFPYENIFRTVRTHILAEGLTGDLDADSRKVYSAIEQGHCYISYDLHAMAGGFSFFLECGSEKKIMGDSVTLAGNGKLVVRSPERTELRLLKHGQVFAAALSKELEVEIDEPGVYRAEASIEGKPWVFTNPIYVRR